MAKSFNERVAEKIAGLRTVDDVKVLAKSIATRADNLDVDMHSAGCGALYCAMTYRDTSAAVAVINSLGRHTRAKAFAEWVEKYSNVMLVLDKKTGLWAGKLVPADMRLDDDKLAAELEVAKGDPFWTPAEKSSRDFSLHASLAILLKKGEQARSKGAMSPEEAVALAELAAIAEKVKPAPVNA